MTPELIVTPVLATKARFLSALPLLDILALTIIFLSALKAKLAPAFPDVTSIGLAIVIVPAVSLSDPDAATEPLPTVLVDVAVDIVTSVPASRASTIARASKLPKV